MQFNPAFSLQSTYLTDIFLILFLLIDFVSSTFIEFASDSLELVILLIRGKSISSNFCLVEVLNDISESHELFEIFPDSLISRISFDDALLTTIVVHSAQAFPPPTSSARTTKVTSPS